MFAHDFGRWAQSEGATVRQQDGVELNRRLVGSASVALVLIFLIQALVVAFPLHLLGQWWVQAAIVTAGVSAYFLTQWLFRRRPGN